MESATHHSKKIEETHTSVSNHDSLNKLTYQQKNQSAPPSPRNNRQSLQRPITVCCRSGAKAEATLVPNVDAQKAKHVLNVTSKVILLQCVEQKSQHVHKIKENNTPLINLPQLLLH